MEKKIKELGENLSAIELELSEVTSLLGDIDVRDMSQPLLDLKETLEAAKTGKEHTLKLFAAGRATRKDLEVSQSKVDSVFRALRNEKEIIEATESLRHELSQKIQALNRKKQGASYGYWRAVSNKIIKDLKNVVGNRVDLAWLAAQLSGANHFGSFTAGLFPQTPIDKITDLRRILDEKYGVK